MNADPMIPKISVTPLAAMVSTNASEGVILAIFCYLNNLCGEAVCCQQPGF
jgi:hypothetical protein